ncbi:MAG: efflux RND transporter periplasmic adaptor subunit, partial [Acidobacteria bacterium]|nr:efflux RND transporter periplasmic adaptor subunit [Acidobacteriota bacterium]
IELEAVGTVQASSSVEVKSQVAGVLLNARFEEGANVRQGELLFEIDPRPYRESLRQAEAAVARDQAQLRLAEANLARDRAQLKNAQADAARFEQLAKEGITPRIQEQQLRTAAEMAEQSVRASEAAIESIRASLESNRAAVDRAQLDLSYCEIRSPISGRVGNLLLHPGNLVKANGDAPLVVINQIAPIFVTFAVPERYLPEIMEKKRKKRLNVRVFATQGEMSAVSGPLTVIDNTVDQETGTIRLKATFSNGGGQLWPGQFVNVALMLEQRNAVVVPAEAVQAGQMGSFVYVVKADKTVEPRPVVTGQTAHGKIIIENGLADGEVVVTDGQSRLYPGATIVTQANPS